jgi:hypothetical protein
LFSTQTKYFQYLTKQSSLLQTIVEASIVKETIKVKYNFFSTQTKVCHF